MPFIVLLGFFLNTSFSSPTSSLFHFDREWFRNENFFNKDAVKTHKIKAIHIWSSEKKDGRIFEEEQSFLHYLFNKEGALYKSYKEVPARNGTDTLIHTYFYNDKNQCVKKVEYSDPFHFIYHYTYSEGKIQSEVKIDGHSSDTSYHHYFKHRTNGNRHTKSVSNDAHKVFKYVSTQRDQKGNVINKRKTFKRNRSYAESEFIYEQNLLREIRSTQFYSKKRTIRSQLDYNGSILQFMNVSENGEIMYKLGFTYNSKGLVDAIIKRIPERRIIRIYRLEYLYY